MKVPELYVEEDPLNSPRKIIYDDSNPSCNNGSLFKMFATSDNIEKFLVSGLTMVKINPTMRLYDAIMRQYIRSEMKVTVTDVETKWKERCWGCHEPPAAPLPYNSLSVV